MEDDDWDPDQGFDSDSNANESNTESNANTNVSQNYDDYFWADGDDDDGSKSDASKFAAGPSSFFTQQDPDSDDDSSEFYDNNNGSDALHSFYNEASMSQTPYSYSQPSTPIFSQLSQTSNISAAELSRMEENLLSQSHHHDAEIDRQRKKDEKKAKAKERSVLRKKKRQSLSESQLKRYGQYYRFRYEKTIDISQEEDVGGSMEYLVRQKLNERGEQRRLMKVARGREVDRRNREIQEQEELERKARESLWSMVDGGDDKLDGDTKETPELKSPVHQTATEAAKSKTKPNWNFLEEGYVTMPSTQAKQLPYYVFNTSNQKLGQSKPKRTRHGNGLWLDDNMPPSGDEMKISSISIPPPQKRQRIESTRDNAKNTNTNAKPHMFPLHFNQLNPRMDLRSFTNMQSWGQDGMTLLHGRHARRLWARMVAGGVTCNMLDTYSANTPDEKAQLTKSEDVASDMSHSSKSSDSFGASDNIYGGSDFRSQFNSQTTFGTSVIGLDTSYNVEEGKGNTLQHNPVFRLMSLVHKLLSFIHRNRFHVKIATELGGLRQVWENEFKPWLDPPQETRDYIKSMLSRTQLSALKSLFGVDGNISPGPFWYADPAMATNPKRMFTRVQLIRLQLIPRLKRLVEEAKRSAGDVQDDIVASCSNKTTSAKEMNNHFSKGIKDEENVDEVKTKIDSIQEGEGAVAKAKSFDASHTREKKEDTELDPENIEAPHTIENKAHELARSLLHTIKQEKDPGGMDKYAKVMHEASIDGTNIVPSLSSFLSELTASKAETSRLQQIDNVTINRQGEISRTRDDAGMWNETIDAYLSLAEKQTRPPEWNIYIREEKVPQSAPFALSVMARQAYAANGGGITCRRKKMQSQASGWQGSTKMEEEHYDSDDYHNEGNDTTSESLTQKELHAIQTAAKDISKRGMEYLTNENLGIFTDVHLTTGIAMVAEHLPPHAAEVVSRKCSPDNADSRTPFDLVGQVLHDLNAQDELISMPTDEKLRWYARGKLIDEDLVEYWEKAALVFRRCIEGDPHNVDHWTWYVATLLGMVIVSSGISLSVCGENNISADIKREGASNEIIQKRQQLQSYHERRTHASRAMKDFAEINESEHCPMFHMALSSMLEWRHAMVLMCRPLPSPTSTFESAGAEVRKLHAYHTHKWASHDCSDIAIARVQELYQTKELPLNSVLDVLACSVEHNPSSTIHWHRLVNMLGAIESSSIFYSVKGGGKSEEQEGVECWWTKRRSEWQENFFRSPDSSHLTTKPEFITMVLDFIDCFEFSTKKKYESDCSAALPKSSGFTSGSLGWIWDPSSCTDELHQMHKNSFVDIALLPAHIQHVLKATNDIFTADSSIQAIQTQLPNDPLCELLCLRIVVAHHMFGDCDFVCNSIWWIAAKHWRAVQEQQSSASLMAMKAGLTWLSSQGFNVTDYIKARHKQPVQC